jgi:hypothetical protein
MDTQSLLKRDDNIFATTGLIMNEFQDPDAHRSVYERHGGRLGGGYTGSGSVTTYATELSPCQEIIDFVMKGGM